MTMHKEQRENSSKFFDLFTINIVIGKRLKVKQK